MNPVRFTGSKSSDRERRVFRRKPQRPVLPPWRQGLEGILMTLLGVGLLAFLVWLPQRLDALVMVSEAIFDLIRGLQQLIEALLGLGAVLLIAAVLFAGLLCLLGGATRVVRALIRVFTAPPRVSRRRRAVPMPRRERPQRRVAPQRR